MKRILAFIVLSLALCAPAEARRRWIPKPSVAGHSFILQEPFTTGSGTTPPSGWVIPAAGTYSYSNVSPSLPNGGNNYKIVSGGFDVTYKTFTNQTGDVYGYVQMNFATILAGRKFIAFRTSAHADVCWVAEATDGTIQIWNSASEALGTVGAITGNTSVYIWFYYHPDPGGSTGIISVGWSTSASRPTSGSNFATRTDSSVSANVAEIALYSNDNNVAQCYDLVTVDNIQIPDSP